jgi:hypothetical protein
MPLDALLRTSHLHKDALNCQELAQRLKRQPHFVTAMRRAGYRLKFEAAGTTTLEHALEALRAAPDFRASHYRKEGWERLPKLLAPKE